MSEPAPEVYAEAFYSADTPTIITDLHFLVRDINRAGQAFTGYRRDEILGEPVTLVTAELAVYEDIVEALVRDETWRGDFALQTKSGTRVYGRGSAAPIVVDGKTRGYVAVFVDTTKQRRYANTSRVLSRLLRHDLRNELNLMYGYLESAADHTDDSTCLSNIRKAREQVEQILGRADHVSDLRRLLEASYDAETHPVRLDEVLEERLLAAERRFPAATFSLATIPEVSVYADDLLPAALDVLLENAVVHNDKETATVHVEAVDRQTDVVVRICDNGPGIPPGQKELVFGREEKDTLHHGTGLGLFMADSIINNYGGTIWVEENDPVGAVFAVRLRHTSKRDVDDDPAPRE